MSQFRELIRVFPLRKYRFVRGDFPPLKISSVVFAFDRQRRMTVLEPVKEIRVWVSAVRLLVFDALVHQPEGLLRLGEFDFVAERLRSVGIHDDGFNHGGRAGPPAPNPIADSASFADRPGKLGGSGLQQFDAVQKVGLARPVWANQNVEWHKVQASTLPAK